MKFTFLIIKSMYLCV